jgi:YfiH family protein
LSPEPFRLDPQHVYRVPRLEQFEWLEHGFGTRHSTGWPDPSRLALLKQVHSAVVVQANSLAGYIGEGDALITDTPGTFVGVRTADCVPILIVDARNRAVAAVHAGWRGTVQQIAVRTISEMSARFGTSPGDVWAAVGPAIGRCCYEVGPEVAARFAGWWPELAASPRPKVDLAATNVRQLVTAGVPESRIFAGALCTFCMDGAFYSFRRERQAAGRMISAIAIR